ncbi:MAG: hypothetical protein IT330_05145 [Anaerolineae bacterium]|nr:hypothetical protein [Anaerolineae bacterium]
MPTVASIATATPAPALTPRPTATTIPPQVTPTAANQPILVWEGSVVWGDSDETKCKAMQVEANHQMTLGYCSQLTARGQAVRQEFLEMETRLAPFQLKAEKESLVFRGKGTLDGPAWQRAVLAWAHWTFAEAFTGRACASCRTVLSWYFGEVPDQAGMCRHLTVLDYGYATAETVPCKGGEVQKQIGGWVETREWEELDEWLYNRATVYKEDNYFLGIGTQQMSEAEVAQLEEWAQGVYERLARP